MREQLNQYVNLLFAGAADCEEIRQEILQNTLDRYDDLLAQGKTPEAAYRLAISGIGDVGELLGRGPRTVPIAEKDDTQPESKENRLKHAVSIAMYILCPVPLFILSEFGLDTMGLCFTLLLVAAATALRMTIPKTAKLNAEPEPVDVPTPRENLSKGVDSVIWAVGVALYFIVSFATKAWYITWIIFPLIGAVQGLVRAILDLKEGN